MDRYFEFTYKLKYEECYETFWALNLKWSQKKRKIIMAILTFIAMLMLVEYYLDYKKVYCFVVAIIDILVLYYLIYIPILKAKNGARKVNRQGGIYKIKLTDKGKVIIQDEVIDLSGDRASRAVETKLVFAIRPDNIHTFCIPKRIMTEEQVCEVQRILQIYMKYQCDYAEKNKGMD